MLIPVKKCESPEKFNLITSTMIKLKISISIILKKAINNLLKRLNIKIKTLHNRIIIIIVNTSNKIICINQLNKKLHKKTFLIIIDIIVVAHFN